MSNPILNENKFNSDSMVIVDEPMTIQGTINKIFMLFVCLLAGSGISFYLTFNGQGAIVPTLMSIGAILGFILVLVTSFNIPLAKYTTPVYAFCEGLFIGGLSIFFEAVYKGIVLQAVALTFAALVVMLLLYKARIIQCTEKFRAVILTSILSIGAIYIIQIIASLFSRSIPGIFDNGPVGIIFSLVVVTIASLSLIQDFDFIERGSERMLSKDYEWYGAMGLMITLVWLYVEILKLLAKLNSRR